MPFTDKIAYWQAVQRFMAGVPSDTKEDREVASHAGARLREDGKHQRTILPRIKITAVERKVLLAAMWEDGKYKYPAADVIQRLLDRADVVESEASK